MTHQPHTPYPLHDERAASESRMPALTLPPVPFLRAGIAPVQSDPMPISSAPTMAAPAPAAPAATSFIDAAMATLTSDASRMLDLGQPLQQPMSPPPAALEPAVPYRRPAPVAAPAPIAPTDADVFPPEVAPTAPVAAAPAPDADIAGIYGAPTEPIGHLATPTHAPAAPADAPGLGLPPTVAAIAATPTAWFGATTTVDDAMLIWNSAPATNAGDPSTAFPTAAAGVAAAGVASTSPAAGGSTLRTLLFFGLPTVGGVAIAFAINARLL